MNGSKTFLGLTQRGGGGFGTLLRAVLVAGCGLLVILAAVSMIGVGDWLNQHLVQFAVTASSTVAEWPGVERLLETLRPYGIPRKLGWLRGSFTEALPLVFLAALLAVGKLTMNSLADNLQESLRKAIGSSGEYIQGDKGAASRSFRAWLWAGSALAVVFAGTGWFGIVNGSSERIVPWPTQPEGAVVIEPKAPGTPGTPKRADKPLMVFATVQVTGENQQASLCGFVSDQANTLRERKDDLMPEVVASVHEGQTPQPGGHLSMIVPKGKWWMVDHCGELAEETEFIRVYSHSIGLEFESPEKEGE